jgi:hypothetical protein
MKSPIRKWAKVRSRHSTEEDIQMENKYMKICSILLVIRNMQIEAIMKYHYISIKMAETKSSDNTKCWLR